MLFLAPGAQPLARVLQYWCLGRSWVVEKSREALLAARERGAPPVGGGVGQQCFSNRDEFAHYVGLAEELVLVVRRLPVGSHVHRLRERCEDLDGIGTVESGHRLPYGLVGVHWFQSGVLLGG